MLKRILILTDTRDWHGNPTNGMKIAKALKQLGHEITQSNHMVNGNHLNNVDLILAFGNLIYPARLNHIERIAQMKNKNSVFALWYFDACNPYFRYCMGKYNRIIFASKHLDWLITTDHSFPWEKHCKNYIQLMQGIDPDEFNREPGRLDNRRYDVIFTGGTDGWFNERKEILRQIAGSFSLIVYGRGSSERIFGDAFFNAYQKARVAYVPPPPSPIPGHYWSNRIYMATATGTPCVVGYTEGLEKHFEDGKEALFFRDGDEACDKIEILLKNPEMRQKIGLAGRERTLREHTYQQRTKELMNNLFGGMK